MNSNLALGGRLGTKVIRAAGPGLRWQLSNYLRPGFIKSLLAVFVALPVARALGLLTAYGTLRAVVVKPDGRRVNYGVVSYRVVTTAFVNFMVDQLQAETTTWGDFKFHDAGVGTTAAAIGDTGIETTDGESRATGTQVEGASANIYRSVGTISYTTTKAVTEHGLFNDATTGTLLDRHVFTAINVVSGDSIQFTYDLTVSAGG